MNRREGEDDKTARRVTDEPITDESTRRADEEAVAVMIHRRRGKEKERITEQTK
jgi:hypothetical protein